MSTIRLTYFALPGRAGPTRLAFTLAGIPFDDIRLTYQEWAAVCDNTTLYPQGSLPVLEVDGKRISDSAAIFEYAASRAGLLPSDAFLLPKTKEIRVYLEQIFTGADALMNMNATRKIEDPEALKAARQGPFTETVKFYLGLVNGVVEEMSTAEGFSIGSTLTASDLAIEMVLTFLQVYAEHFVFTVVEEAFPKLLAIRNQVNAIPAVKAFLAAKP
jgi:glutathione S-transferase